MDSSKHQESTKRKHKPSYDRLYLARYGGLNIVKQKGNYGRDTFHAAPERYGCYAYIFPFIDLFLISSTKTKEFKEGTYKKFEAIGGYVWTHIEPVKTSMIIEEKNAWYKVRVEDMPKILRKAFAVDTGYLFAMNRYGFSHPNKDRKELNKTPMHKNPYNSICTDHLEVFITRETIIS